MAETTRFVIHTFHETPPIPIRSMDWVAWVDGQEEWGTGSGPTEEAAIADLLAGLEVNDAAYGEEFEIAGSTRVVRIDDGEVVEVEDATNAP